MTKVGLVALVFAMLGGCTAEDGAAAPTVASKAQALTDATCAARRDACLLECGSNGACQKACAFTYVCCTDGTTVTSTGAVVRTATVSERCGFASFSNATRAFLPPGSLPYECPVATTPCTCPEGSTHETPGCH